MFVCLRISITKLCAKGYDINMFNEQLAHIYVQSKPETSHGVD